MKVTINEFKVGDKIKFDGDVIEIKNITKENFEIEFQNNIYNISKNNLFDLLTLQSRKIITHNCQERLVCGQLGSIASRMALGDNQATTIDGTHKGAGMVSSQGIVSNIQYYFEEQKWITDWYRKRGLTDYGYEVGEDPNEEIDPSSIDLGEDEDIEITENKTNIDFNGIHKEVDHTKAQKFEEI